MCIDQFPRHAIIVRGRARFRTIIVTHRKQGIPWNQGKNVHTLRREVVNRTYAVRVTWKKGCRSLRNSILSKPSSKCGNDSECIYR